MTRPREELVQLGRDLLGRNRLDRTGVRLGRSALHLIEPSPLDLGLFLERGDQG